MSWRPRIPLITNLSKSFENMCGRFVIFQSDASNLVGRDTNGMEDIVVRDRQTGETTRVLLSTDGAVR